MIQNCRSIDRLCQSPVHSVMYHWFSFPVCGIYDTWCPICIPCIFHCTVKQIFCCFHIFCSTFLIFFMCRKCPLGNQSRPFNSMSRCCTVWFELVCWLLFIAFQICFPFFCKMLRNSPTVIRSPYQNTVNDTACSYAVFLIPCYICCCKKCFYCMHIGIQSSVIIQNRKFCIPGITGQSFFFIPETQVIKFQGIL